MTRQDAKQAILSIIQARLGEANAITVRGLQRETGIKDERYIRRLIHELRHEGHWIASTANGYFTPVTQDEKQHTLAILKNNGVVNFGTVRDLERIADSPEVPVQMNWLKEAA